MKMCALGMRGFTRGCMLTWCGSRSPLRRLHGAQEATMLSQPEPPPLEGGMTWSTLRLVRAPQYWHCQPSRANTARRVILRLCVSRGMRTYATSRMTTGRGSEPVAQWSSLVPISTTSAFALSRSTVARRTVQTLIGSYVAFRTSTRPPDQRPQPSEAGPCRWWSAGGTDPSGAGGTAAVAIAAGKCTHGFRGTRAVRAVRRFAPWHAVPRRNAVRAVHTARAPERGTSSATGPHRKGFERPDAPASAAGARRRPSVQRDGADLAGQGDADGLRLLGRELDLAFAAVDLLAVQPGGLAVGDRGEHDAAVVRVEQRERRRLVARELAVGVVADQRAV